jgi:hypothetical protein
MYFDMSRYLYILIFNNSTKDEDITVRPPNSISEDSRDETQQASGAIWKW